MNEGAEESLKYWQKILEDLGFEHKFYDYLNCELVGVDWYKADEHIITGTHYSQEYWDYLETLPGGTEFDPDWEQCIVSEIIIETKEFGYPEGEHNFDGDWEGGIHLSSFNKSYYENFTSLSLDNFKKALWMSRNPISAKTEIAMKFLSESSLFLRKYSKLLKDFGFKEEGSSLLLVGTELTETEPLLSYSYDGAYNIGDFNLCYNMFTERLFWTRIEKNLGDSQRLYPSLHYQVNVNDLTEDEFKAELIRHLKYNNLFKTEDETD